MSSKIENVIWNLWMLINFFKFLFKTVSWREAIFRHFASLTEIFRWGFYWCFLIKKDYKKHFCQYFNTTWKCSNPTNAYITFCSFLILFVISPKVKIKNISLHNWPSRYYPKNNLCISNKKKIYNLFLGYAIEISPEYYWIAHEISEKI